MVNEQLQRTLIPIAVMLTVLGAEWLHARRCRRVARLAFGPFGRPQPWTRVASPLRVAASGALAWGLLVLLQLDEAQWARTDAASHSSGSPHHVVIGLDVSPSMHIADAGPDGKQARADRARDVLRSMLERLDLRRSQVSIIAFYHKARPVVVDTFDPEVVNNILSDLPLEQAFRPGLTNLYDVARVAEELSKKWRPGTASLIVVSDGDTLPPGNRPTLGKAFSNVTVLGVGNPFRGTYIHNHHSRQDRRSLSLFAAQLGGEYIDVTSHHLSSDALPTGPVEASGSRPFANREWAICAVVAGALTLTLLPIALAAWGGIWNPRHQTDSYLYRDDLEQPAVTAKQPDDERLTLA